jgi:hypothetical protein
MPDDEEQDDTTQEEELGEFIFENTPYSTMELADDWKEYVEWDGNTVLWNFRELPRRIRKSIRIPVKITIWVDKATEVPGNVNHVKEQYLDWLVIGYEGGGGM